ncbi:MAG: chaperonin GroEL [Methylococcales bacterium]|nr:chaperonin GroEL [Methylococcales bacterium]
MTKQIIYNPKARLKMMQGIDSVAKAAVVTMGSSGPAVMIQHRTDGIMPIFTRDGVTVARSIHFSDRIVDLGGRMLRDVAGAVSRQVGDGTTTSIVLAQKLAQESVKSVTAGFHPLELKKGLDLALTIVEKHLLDSAMTDITSDWIEKISAVATKNEPGVGKLLSHAIEELGIDGELTFQLGNSREDEIDIVDGIHYEQGYLSPSFITDKNRAEAVLEHPYILLYDREISDLMDVVPILEEVKAQGRPLLIIAENVIDGALKGLLLNHIRGIFNVVCVKPPGFGDKRIDRLKDLAILTGGQAILDDYSSPKLEHVTLDLLGQAKRVVITESSTTIIGSNSNHALVHERITNLRTQAEIILSKKPGEGSPTGNKHDFEEIEERIALLSGKTGVFSVGGVADFEIKERMVRIENAYMSAKAALEEGVLPGGGVALFNCIPILNKVMLENTQQQQGIYIMKQALIAPLQSLCRNVELNPEEVIARLKTFQDANTTIDMKNEKYGNFLDIGIIDSVKVMRLALRNAVSVVATMMTTEAIVMNVPDLSIMEGYSPEWAAATREDPRQ